ncbi:MAG: raffinose/stachyose/melibiose transport system permease protein, partial [Thermomicrobiales bacterium]|nr:raffinose/stachyose/melibiose transport system permease protein [Thermomicrobiales bacterium]
MAEIGLATRQTGSRRAGRHWARYRAGYLFVLPAFLLYAVFMIYPFFQSIYLSFTSWNGADPVKDWVGLGNYREFLHDDLLWKALQHNLIWVVIGTIAPMALGLLLAVLLWRRPRGFTLFRTTFFMPQVLSSVVIAIVWGWLYNPVFGLLN